MQRTARILLAPTPEQANLLAETMKLSTQAFNTVCAYAWGHDERNGVELHKATYYDLRTALPQLPAQLVCSARVRATEAICSAFTLRSHGDKVSCPQGSNVAVRYDARSYRVLPMQQIASLATVGGRQEVAYILHDHAAHLFEQAIGFDSADLCLLKGQWWLHVVLSLPTPAFKDSGEAVGVDLGLNRPAVTSNRKFLGQRRWREKHNRYFRIRRKLQRKGTKSAKRHLKRLSRRLRRFRLDCDHVLSKRIVQSCKPGTTIVVENLKEIRKRTKQKGRQSRRRLHSWSFAQMRAMLTYKAEAAACRVVGIDPRHTSQRCSRCGYIYRGNRKSQAVFLCRKCGYELNADFNASINIAAKYLASVGISDAGGLLSESLSSPSAISSPLVSSPENDFDEGSSMEQQRVTSLLALAVGI